MLASSLLIMLASAGLIEARSVLDLEVRHLHGRHHKRAGDDATATILAANAIQSGSFVDGSAAAGSAAGQAKSQTSKNNFINNCAGKVLTNGLQVATGSCNGITMGDIPAKTNMVSSIIIFPESGGADVEANTTFNITVQMANLVPGSFTNAAATYYAAPQALEGGKVVGHTHVTVQDLGSTQNPKQPLDATKFVFFKGINDAGNGQGLLSATVTGGLPPGNYRVCTMASASNHQPVLMPVAQRGTPDDCTKFTVSGNGKAANSAASGSTATIKASSVVASQKDTASALSTKNGGGKDVVKSSSVSVPTFANATVSSSDVASKTKKGGNGGKAASTSLSVVSVSSKSIAASTSVANAEAAQGGKNGGKGGKASSKTLSVASASSVPISATASSTSSAAVSTTKSGASQGGKGNGGKGTKASSSVSIANVLTSASPISVAASTSIVASTTSKLVKGGNGKAVGTGVGKSGSVTTVIVHKVTVIETFFVFVLSLGGLPPSVGKKGNSWVVLEELFSELPDAASAACGHQFTTCISFSEPGFSFEKCTSQKDTCGSAASVAVSSSEPATLTATVTVPTTATVTGSVISEVTVTTTIEASPTGNNNVAKATSAPAVLAATTPSTCALVTSTVFVDEPLPTLAAVSSSVKFSNSTASATSVLSSATSTSTSTSSKALGGIEAPAIQLSGDSARPFLVNGNTFVNKAAAVQRSCDIQFNACANAVNGGKATGFVFADCTTQQTACQASG